jgi:hypothetical protein
MPIPRGKSAPTGIVLSAIFDAHTGTFDGMILSNEAIPSTSLARLGVVTKIQ